MADEALLSRKQIVARQRAQQMNEKKQKGKQAGFTRARSQEGQPIAYKKVKEYSVFSRRSRAISDPEIPGSLVILNAKGLFEGKNGNGVQSERNSASSVSQETEKERPVFFDPSLHNKEGEFVCDLKKKFEALEGEWEAKKVGSDFLNPLHKVNSSAKPGVNRDMDTESFETTKKKLESVVTAKPSVPKQHGVTTTPKPLTALSKGTEAGAKSVCSVQPPKRPPPRLPTQRLRGESDPMPLDEHSTSRVIGKPESVMVEPLVEEEAARITGTEGDVNDRYWNDDDEPIDNPDDFDDDDDDDDDEYDEWGSDFDSDDDERKHTSHTIDGSSCEAEPLVFPDAVSKKLYNIALEILTTERAYVRRLYLLDQVFYHRLNNECCAKGHLPVEALNEIFSNIQAIHQLHKDFFLPKLESRLKEWPANSKIGDILKELAPFLKLYTHYIGNFDKATEALSSWTKKSLAMATLIEEIQKSKECENLTLQHHMLEPVQRVPRYKLLLKDYVSKLPEDSEDFMKASDALEMISESACHANESMKKTERFKKLLEIQERIVEDYHLVTPSREFVTEGEFIKVSARRTETHQERTLMLFNDALLCCAKFPGTNKYKVKVTMDLYRMQVGSPDEDLEMPNTFRIISKQRVMDFAASSLEGKEEWVRKLEEAIYELTEKRDSYRRVSKIEVMDEGELGKKAPVWVRDEAVSMCMLCDVMFTAIRRRHHCRACGRVVCRTCSGYKAPLDYDDGKQNRICEVCHKVLVKGASAESVKDSGEKETSKFKISRESKIWCSGYLNFKRKGDKNWQKRWFVLSDDFVLYSHKAKKDTKAEFTTPLPGYEVGKPTLGDEVDRRYVIKLSHRNVPGYFYDAESEENMNRWKEFFSRAVLAEKIEKKDEQENENEEDGDT